MRFQDVGFNCTALNATITANAADNLNGVLAGSLTIQVDKGYIEVWTDGVNDWYETVQQSSNVSLARVSGTLTTLQLLSLNTNPIDIIPALGASVVTVPVHVNITLLAAGGGATAYATATMLELFGTTIPGGISLFSLDCLAHTGSSPGYAMPATEITPILLGSAQYQVNTPISFKATGGGVGINPTAGNYNVSYDCWYATR